MGRKTRIRLGAALAIIALTYGLVAVWWWALYGMSEPIGMAHYFTSLSFAFAGVAVGVSGASA